MSSGLPVRRCIQSVYSPRRQHRTSILLNSSHWTVAPHIPPAQREYTSRAVASAHPPKTASLPRPGYCHAQPKAEFLPTTAAATTARRTMASTAAAQGKEDPALNPELVRLFNDIEAAFRSSALKDDAWYILAIACLVASPDPELSAQLYVHLRNQPGFETSESRQSLIRRLREALVKATIIVGVPKPLEATLAIAAVERPEDRDYTCTRGSWSSGQENHDRGMAWLGKLYARNMEGQLDMFDAHRDFGWISTEITYGLFLSDRQTLDDLETEMVVLPAIMMQNLPNETGWHIRGTRRIGVSKADCEIVYDCIKKVATFMGLTLNKVPTVDQVEPEV